MWAHSHLYVDFGIFWLTHTIAFIKNIGITGVGIFAYLSGFGIYWSLKKEFDIYRYCVKRIIRIFPVYWGMAVISMIYYQIKNGDVTIGAIIGNLSIIGFLAEGKYQLNWFVSMIVICYLIAPYVYSALEHFDTLHGAIFKFITINVSVMLTFLFVGNVLFIKISILVVIFILGMLRGSRRKPLPILFSIILILLGLVALLMLSCLLIR